MHAAKPVDKKALRTLSPLAGLSPDKLEELASKSAFEEFPAGRLLFRTGDNDRRLLYVLSGEVELISDSSTRVVKAGSAEARQPLSIHVPHRCAARAKSRVGLLIVDRDLLDLLQNDPGDFLSGGGYEVAEIDCGAGEDDAWMIRFLQSPAFSRLPAETLQTVLTRMQSLQLNAGAAVVRQGAQDAYYYILKSGRCLVSRQPAPRVPEIRLAELGAGDGFGEEALLTGGRRNATVTMIEDGVVMRLEKEDFERLLAAPLLRRLAAEQARTLAESGGAALIDVRPPDEFAHDGLPGAMNLPLPTLRLKLSSLLPGREYIVYCNDGRQSMAAAFLMCQKGLMARVLEGGRGTLAPPSAPGPAANAAPAGPPEGAGGGRVVSLQQRAAAGAERARRAEETARRLRAEAEAARRRAEENAQRLEATRTQLEAQITQLKSEVNARQQAEIQKAQQQAEREAEAARAAQEARQLAERAAQQAQREAEAVRRQVEEETARIRAQAEAERKRAEAEARRLIAEAERAKREAEAQVARLAEQAHSAAAQNAAATRQRAEAEAQRVREAAQAMLRHAEAEAARIKTEVEKAARQLAETRAARRPESVRAQAPAPAPAGDGMAELKAELEAAQRTAAAAAHRGRHPAGRANPLAANGGVLQPAAPGSVRAGLEIDVGEMKREAVRVRTLGDKTIIEGDEDIFVFQPPSLAAGPEFVHTEPGPGLPATKARRNRRAPALRPIEGDPQGVGNQPRAASRPPRRSRLPLRAMAAALILGAGLSVVGVQRFGEGGDLLAGGTKAAQLAASPADDGWLVQIKRWLGLDGDSGPSRDAR